MAMNDSASDKPSVPVAKRPYEKPSFRFEKVFVVTALACGKIDPTQATCFQNTKVS